MEPKYDLKVKLVGTDGNAFALMGRVSSALLHHGVSKGERDQFIKEATAGDYPNLLRVCTEWVHVH